MKQPPQHRPAACSRAATAVELSDHNFCGPWTSRGSRWILVQRENPSSEAELRGHAKTSMKITCGLCKGSTKHFAYPKTLSCPLCNGLGELTILGAPVLRTCPRCAGSGRHFAFPSVHVCPVCNGLALLTEDGVPPTIVQSSPSPPLEPVPPSSKWTLVAEGRLNQLRALKPGSLDFQKLIQLCEELNTAYSQGCYLATIMLTRSLLDHVPPVFGMAKFTEVVNNYSGGKSFKENMQRLEDAARNIADTHLHTPMRAKETLPTAQQVNFGPQLDVLLAEIVRITH